MPRFEITFIRRFLRLQDTATVQQKLSYQKMRQAEERKTLAIKTWHVDHDWPAYHANRAVSGEFEAQSKTHRRNSIKAWLESRFNLD